MPTSLRILEAVQHSTEKLILATIVQIDGSAYLREGSSMLIMENGQTIGMISPGCLEEDLILRSKEIFLSQYPQTLVYDLRSIDDYGWGQGMGCNGVMRIVLEPVTEKLKTDLLFLKKSLENGLPVLHKKAFSEDFTLKRSSFEIGSGSANTSYQISRAQDGYQYTYLFTPPPTVYIFGAGDDAKPLVSLAARNGFIVKLCDWRPGLCNESHFPSANQFIIGSPQQILQSINLSKNDFIIVMSHNFSKDQEFLVGLRDCDCRYIGILGSRERTRRLLSEELAQKNLYFPIGLSIGAQGSEEIAVSIMAELIQTYREKQP